MLLSLFLCSPASGSGLQWAETVMEVGRFNKRKSTFTEGIAMAKNSLMALAGIDTAFHRFYTQFSINCSKDYPEQNPVPLLIDHINAETINRTNLNLLSHTAPQGLPCQDFKITVIYGDDDIFGKSQKYVGER